MYGFYKTHLLYYTVRKIYTSMYIYKGEKSRCNVKSVYNRRSARIRYIYTVRSTSFGRLKKYVRIFVFNIFLFGNFRIKFYNIFFRDFALWRSSLRVHTYVSGRFNDDHIFFFFVFLQSFRAFVIGSFSRHVSCTRETNKKH